MYWWSSRKDFRAITAILRYCLTIGFYLQLSKQHHILEFIFSEFYSSYLLCGIISKHKWFLMKETHATLPTFGFPVGKLFLGCAVITDLKCTVSRSLRVCVVWTRVWLTGRIHIYWTHAHMLLRKALTEEELDHLGETDMPFKKLWLHWPPWAHCFVFPRLLVLWRPHQHLASINPFHGWSNR